MANIFVSKAIDNIRSMFILIFGMLISPFTAACTNPQPMGGIVTPTQSIPAKTSAVVGSVLKSITVNSPGVYLSCRPDQLGGATVKSRLAYVFLPATISPVGSNVYNTNLAGVGMRVRAKPGNGYSDFYATNPDTTVNSSFTLRSEGGYTFYDYYIPTMILEYVKTGTITPGKLTNSNVAIYYSQGNPNTFPQYIGVYAIQESGNTTFTNTGCTITTSTVNIPLGNIPISSFTSVGTTLGSRNFNVGLNCTTGTKIFSSLSATQNADTSDQSIIALTGAGTAGVASGIGVQILRSGTPMNIGTEISIGTATNGAQNIGFSARYYQTLPNVLAGNANTTATLNMTYQ